MSRGKKKEIFQKKITQFPKQLDRPEELTDENIDRILRESIRMEADEIEAQMNQDPTLIGVGASDDLFSKIVAELKDRGEWEEEAELQARGEREGEAVLQVHGEREGEAVLQVHGEREEEAELQAHGERGEEAVLQVRGEREGEAGLQVHREREEEAELKCHGEHEEETLSEKKLIDEEALPQQNRELIRSMLSEEDREALEFGYQMKARERKKQEKRKKRRKHLKQTGIAAAGFVAVLGVGMSSEANQKRVMQIWNAVMENFDTRLVVNYLAEKEAYKASKEEEKAKKVIQDQLGIAPVVFAYLPKDSRYLSYEIDKKANCALMRYKCRDIFFDVCMRNGDNEGGSYYQIDGEIQEEEMITNEQGITARITKIATQDNEYSVAMFANDECNYYCGGELSYEEMKKIIKFFMILED